MMQQERLMVVMEIILVNIGYRWLCIVIGLYMVIGGYRWL